VLSQGLELASLRHVGTPGLDIFAAFSQALTTVGVSLVAPLEVAYNRTPRSAKSSGTKLEDHIGSARGWFSAQRSGLE